MFEKQQRPNSNPYGKESLIVSTKFPSQKNFTKIPEKVNGKVIPGSGIEPCSGHGRCECGTCQCYEFGAHYGEYTGHYCEKFNTQVPDLLNLIFLIL